MMRVLFLTILCIATGLAMPSSRQEIKKNPSSHIQYVEPSAEYSLKNAEEFEAQSRFDEAMKIYVYIMEEHKNTVIKSTDDLYLGAWHYCINRITKWPEKGITAYRKYYDKLCELKFNDAKKQRDREKLLQIAREYPLSSYFVPCIALAAELALEESEIDLAVRLLEEAINKEQSKKDKIETIVKKLAFAYHLAQNKSKLEELYNKFSYQHIKDLIPKTKEAPIANHVNPDENIDELIKGFSLEIPTVKFSGFITPDYGHRSERFNPFVPAVKDGFLYTANDYSVRAYDLFSTGELVWSYDLAPPSGELYQNDRVVHYITVNDNICYANLITSLGLAEILHSWSLIVKYPFPKRSLFALDAYSGKFLWKRDDLSYTSAPKIEGNYLYIGAIKQLNPTDPFEHFVLCINKRTGDLIWKTRIAKGITEINLFGNSLRESIGSPVSINGNTLFYCTNLGTACGLDLTTGNIKWLFKYETVPIQPTRQLPVINPIGWINNKPICTSDGFVFTPTDSEYLYAIEKDSGKIKYTLKRNDLVYMNGVRGNKLVLAGGKMVILDINSGKETTIPINANSTGFGTILGSKIIVPSERSTKIYEITNQKLERDIESSFKTFNLVIGEGSVITVDPNGKIDVLFEKSADKIDHDRDPVLFCYNKAVELLRKGNMTGAKDLFEKVFKHTQSSSNPRDTRLYAIAKIRIYLILIKLSEKRLKEEDLNGAERFLEKALKFTKSEEDEISVRFKLCSIIAKKDPRKAISIALHLIREFPQRIYEGQQVFETAREVIDVIITANGRSVYQEYDQMAQKLLDKALKIGAPLDINGIFDLYPNATCSEDALLKVYKIYHDLGRLDEAISTLKKLIKYFPKSTRIPQLHADIASCYNKNKQIMNAHREILVLANRYPDCTVIWEEKSYKPKQILENLKIPNVRFPSSTIKAPMKLISSLEVPQTFSMIMLSDKKALFLTGDKTIDAFDLKTTRHAYNFQTDSRINSVFPSDDALVVCCSTNIYLLDPEKGTKIWVHSQKNMISPATIGCGFLAWSSGKGISSEITLLDLSSKANSWAAHIKGISSEISITSTAVVVKAHNPESIYVFDLLTSERKLEKKIEAESYIPGSLIGVWEDMAFIRYETTLVGVNISSGTVWKTNLPRDARVVCNEKYALIIESDGKTKAESAIIIDNKTGKRKECGTVATKPSKCTLVYEDNLVIVSDNNLMAFPIPDLKPKWNVAFSRSKPDLSSIKISGNLIALCSNTMSSDGSYSYNVALFKTSSGDRVQELKKEGQSRLPAEIAIAGDKLTIKTNEQVEVYR